MQSQPMVYVVEDDPAVRNSIAWLLESDGLNAAFFDGPNRFLNEAKVCGPSCLILDMMMPGMTGLELLKVLSQRPELSMPAIMLTAGAKVSDAVESMKLGARDFLEKPADHAVLLQRVRQALASDASNRAEGIRKSALRQRVDRLTEREREVLRLLSVGNSTKQMAVKLNISNKTVSIHRWHLMKKLQVASATEAVHLAWQAGI